MNGLFNGTTQGTADDGFGNRVPLSNQAWWAAWIFYYVGDMGGSANNAHPVLDN